jgi:hypothetical protein
MFMSDVDPSSGSTADGGGEREPRSDAASNSAPQDAASGPANEGAGGGGERDADSELHLAGEAQTNADTLYRDGLDLDEEYDAPAGTRGSSGTIP